jgi:hypothetical protein
MSERKGDIKLALAMMDRNLILETKDEEQSCYTVYWRVSSLACSAMDFILFYNYRTILQICRTSDKDGDCPHCG